jgi:hypothetical protein
MPLSGPITKTICLFLGILSVHAEPEVTVHTGMGGASAAVFLGTNLVVVANDEDNVLRTYRTDQAGAPVGRYDVSPWLNLHGQNREADLEGAARVGNRIYWIGSHGRNKDGKPRPNRHRFFATEVSDTDVSPSLRFTGSACSTLIEQMAATPGYESLGLLAATSIPPNEPGGLNIEALAAGADSSLLIGFRGPVPDGRALIAPLLNPAEVIDGKPARFGPPIRLDLDARGLRDMTWTGSDWLLIAGATGGDDSKPKLFRWSGGQSAPVHITKTGIKNFNPEAAAMPPGQNTDRLFVCSDDGKRGKKGANPTFRSFWIDAGR